MKNLAKIYYILTNLAHNNRIFYFEFFLCFLFFFVSHFSFSFREKMKMCVNFISCRQNQVRKQFINVYFRGLVIHIYLPIIYMVHIT